MLPETHDNPALAPQAPHVAHVTAAIGVDLRLPGGRELVAPYRESPSVPEVPIHEYGNPGIAHDEVGAAWQIPYVAFEGYAGTQE
jgi:hypothetical protein